MTKLIFTILISLIVFTGFSQDQKQNLHCNHKVFGINKLDARASYFAIESEARADQNIAKKSERVLSLNGKWKFNQLRD